MSFSNQFEADILGLIFNATAISGLADNASASPLTNLYVALHTADPGEGGNQATSEVNYTGYARVAVQRTGAGWTLAGQTISPTAVIEFGEMTAGTSSTATYAAVGTAASGAGKYIIRGALSPTIPYQVGTVPRIRANSTITLD